MMACYLDQIPWFMITCLVGVLAWGMGAAYTGRPSEDEMRRRLIGAEAARRIKSQVAQDINYDIAINAKKQSDTTGV